MLWAIWHQLHNSKNVKNTHGRVMKPPTLLEVSRLHRCFSNVFNMVRNHAKRQIRPYTSNRRSRNEICKNKSEDP